MPQTPDHARSFLLALSDFWSVYFKDRELLRGYFDGVALNAAQLYQKLLETALGTSLADVPLFARDFYRPYTVREDLVRYEEGASIEEDSYVFSTEDGLVSGTFITNRIIAPTSALIAPRDFTVSRDQIRFRADPFGGALAHFPMRTATVVAPSAWRDPLDRSWVGVRPGDALRVAVGGAVAEAAVTGVDAATLYLDAAPSDMRAALAWRGCQATVLRTPYDDTVSGVQLPDHPLVCGRLSRDANDGTSVASSGDVDVSGVGTYQGTWSSSGTYEVGDIVWQSGRAWQALVAHSAGVSFDATLWDDLATGFFYVHVAAAPHHDGLYGATTPGSLGRVTLSDVTFLGAHSVTLHRVRYASASGARAVLPLGHRHLRAGSVSVSARRAVARVTVDASGVSTTHPAFEAVIEGVDYRVDYEAGRVVALSAWDPLRPARADYRWRLEVAARLHRWRGSYAPATPYLVGDLLDRNGVTYVVVRDHTSDGTFDARYRALREPLTLAVARAVREIAIWLTDALLDEGRLYRNFGHLLDRRRPSSEAQRAFLQAISRLFLQGPSFPLLESALTALAGLPLVREDGETLVKYDDGVTESAATGRLYDTMQGSDGALDPGTSRFSAATAAFQATDVGAVIRVVRGAAVEVYTVTSVVSGTVVVVAPAPATALSGAGWEARHVSLTNRLRLSSGGVQRFLPEAVGAWVRLTGRHARNRGVFRVSAVDDAFTAELDTPYGFLDEEGVTWELSPRGVQAVVTSSRRYEVPLGVPVRADLRDPSNAGVLKLAAFDPVTSAFTVVDYLSDPSWWHHVQIPVELFPADAATRTVTPALIEHVYGALDEPRHGDPGLNYGVDDVGAPPTARPCTATWYGGADVVLSFAAGVPGLRTRDVGSYLVVESPGFAGHFPILRVHEDGATITLDRFPPAASRPRVPPQVFDAELPPLLLRHAVAFILMDRLLKYHCAHVRMDTSVSLPRGVIEDMARAIGASRPSHVYVFFEAGTRFEEQIEVAEALTLDLDRGVYEPLRGVDTAAAYNATGLLRYGDAYRFVDRDTAVTPTPETPISLPTVLPSSTGVVRTLVKVGFHTGARVGARQPCEGVDYDVDYVAGTLTVRAGVSITPSPVTVYYVDCIRRTLSPGDPLDPGETEVVYGGADPTIVRGAAQDPRDAGFLDRAIQLTFGS